MVPASNRPDTLAFSPVKRDGRTASDAAHRPDFWARPGVSRHVVRDLGEGQCEVLLVIDGIRCAGCIQTLERILSAESGVSDIEINVASRRARVRWQAPTTLPRLLDVFSAAGYKAIPLESGALDDARRTEARLALKRLVVAAFGAMQAMMYAVVLYFVDTGVFDIATRDFFRWLGFLVATPVVFYSAKPFFVGAARSLKARLPAMDVPVALAVAGIYVASLIEAIRGGEHVYFESVSMFVFFLLVGRYIEVRARHRAGDLTDALVRLSPSYANRRLASGELERVGIHELHRGNRVHIAEGGIVPADGVLLSPRCLIDESLLSGESVPVEKRRGDPLVAGSLLVEGPADLQVERTGAATKLAGIAELVARAQASRPRLARAGEQAASRFVVRVLLLTGVTVVAWSVVDPSRAFTAALAVLVVSCPCAFALAVPVAITRAIALLARRGVLIVKADAIEALAGTTHVVFDKTGTLTRSDCEVTRIRLSSGESQANALRLAAALARESRHPAARAIAAICPRTLEVPVVDAHVDVGLGIRGTVDGREIRLGRPEYALPGNSAPCRVESDVILADSQGVIAAFRLRENLRAEARDAILALQGQGLHVSISSGDAPNHVRDIARRLGVEDWWARQLPEDKLSHLATLRESGKQIMAVGDGVNDAPVLGGADLAVSLAEGAELAQATSDIVITEGALAQLAPARTIAIETLRILRQNQRWALCYNFLAVPLAALGFVPPLIAALGMSISSLVVVLNAMRIDYRPVSNARRGPLERAQRTDSRGTWRILRSFTG